MTRKFIVAEALYYNWGDLTPLPKLVRTLFALFMSRSVTQALTNAGGVSQQVSDTSNS